MSRSQPDKSPKTNISEYIPTYMLSRPGYKDRYYYDRHKAAKKLDKKVWEIEDEPDDIRYDLKEKENYDEQK